MPIKRPDKYEHSNPNLPIVDIAETTGGLKQVSTFGTGASGLGQFLGKEDKFKIGTTLVALDTNALYYLTGPTVTDPTSWTSYGALGTTGLQGPQGFQGVGTQGLRGFQGFQGAGVQGSVGPQGLQGIGTQGPAGGLDGTGSSGSMTWFSGTATVTGSLDIQRYGTAQILLNGNGLSTTQYTSLRLVGNGLSQSNSRNYSVVHVDDGMGSSSGNITQAGVVSYSNLYPGILSLDSVSTSSTVNLTSIGSTAGNKISFYHANGSARSGEVGTTSGDSIYTLDTNFYESGAYSIGYRSIVSRYLAGTKQEIYSRDYLGSFQRRLSLNENGKFEIGTTSSYYTFPLAPGTSGQTLVLNGNDLIWETPSATASISGSGTTDYVARWISSNVLGIGSIKDDGSLVCIGTSGSTSGYVGTFNDSLMNYGSARIQGRLSVGEFSIQPKSILEIRNPLRFDKVFDYNGATYTDLTITAYTGLPAANYNVCPTTSSYFYVGAYEKFEKINFPENNNGVNYNLVFEYYGSSGWTSFSPTDGTLNFTVSEWNSSVSVNPIITWSNASIPTWTSVSVNGSDPLYYIRISTTTTPSTLYSSNLTIPGDRLPLLIFANYGDQQYRFNLDYKGFPEATNLFRIKNPDGVSNSWQVLEFHGEAPIFKIKTLGVTGNSYFQWQFDNPAQTLGVSRTPYRLGYYSAIFNVGNFDIDFSILRQTGGTAYTYDAGLDTHTFNGTSIGVSGAFILNGLSGSGNRMLFTNNLGVVGATSFSAGPQGVQGAQGVSGTIGIDGVQGPQGLQGPQGNQGFQGLQGPQGNQGFQGDTGLGFKIAKSYTTVASLLADTSPTGILAGEFGIVITVDPADPDNGRLYLWDGLVWTYTVDMSVQGIQGPDGLQGNQGLQGPGATNGIFNWDTDVYRPYTSKISSPYNPNGNTPFFYTMGLTFPSGTGSVALNSRFSVTSLSINNDGFGLTGPCITLVPYGGYNAINIDSTNGTTSSIYISTNSTSGNAIKILKTAGSSFNTIDLSLPSSNNGYGLYMAGSSSKMIGVKTASGFSALDVIDNTTNRDKLKILPDGLYIYTGATSNYYVAIKGPSSLSGDFSFTLPGSSGSSGQAMITDGVGNLSWGTVSGAPVGVEGSVQYKSGSVLGGTAGFVYNSSTSALTLVGNFYMPSTTGSNMGIIYKNNRTFIHDYSSSGNGNNIFIGLSAGNLTTTGSNNIGIGSSALSSNTNGANNVSIGINTLRSNLSGGLAIAIGDDALSSNISGGVNIAIGKDSMLNNVNGNFNTAVGVYSLRGNTAGSLNTSIGYNSMYAGRGAINTAIGSDTLKNNTGSANNALGSYALFNNITGNSNTSIGSYSGYSLTAGSGNVFIGASAGYNETGSNKLYISNSTTTSPLIGGDFASRYATIGGDLRLMGSTSGYVGFKSPSVGGSVTYTFPASTGASGQVLATDGSGILSWSSSSGPQGPQGLQGLTGTNGSQGPQGLQGSQGPQGLQGATGTFNGPVSTTNTAIATWNGTGGTALNNTNVLINTIGDISVGSTTGATSTTTGALKVAGGVGISGSLYVGGLTGATANTLIGVDLNGRILDTGILAETQMFDLIIFAPLTGATGATSTEIPPKYELTSVVFESTNANAVTINIGSTVSGGIDVVNGSLVNGNTLQQAALGTTIFSTGATQTLYISSTNWNSSTLNIYIKMEKFAQ